MAPTIFCGTYGSSKNAKSFSDRETEKLPAASSKEAAFVAPISAEVTPFANSQASAIWDMLQ